MKIKRLYENSTEKISVSDILNYAKMKYIIDSNANKYFQLHKDELDEEDFDVNNMIVHRIYISDNKITIEVKDNDYNQYEDFELSLSDFVDFCNDPEVYMSSKKYNL